ncbi:hypothetical protein HYR69_09880 [Candidatus Sumerlaeota bacterium]|nr:hypothetical protein [Candidatus Sumerlaeota bacterium]
MAKHELGCGGTISYPISHKAEEWFMNQFNPPDGEKGFVAHHIKANRLTGSRMDARRPGVSANGPVFSSDIPVVKRLSAQGNPISSSQIFEFIFGCSPALLPITLLGLGTDFRIAELSDKDRKELNMIESMNQMMGSDGRGRDAFAKSKAAIVNRYPPAIKLQSEDDTSIQQLKRFFGLGWIAYMSGHPLAIDA